MLAAQQPFLYFNAHSNEKRDLDSFMPSRAARANSVESQINSVHAKLLQIAKRP